MAAESQGVATETVRVDRRVDGEDATGGWRPSGHRESVASQAGSDRLQAAASFDEAWYLKRNPDIAAAVADGTVSSGLSHWTTNGRNEGRAAPPGFNTGVKFDEAAYLTANPDVAEAVRMGTYETGREHYDQAGRIEGRSLGVKAAPTAAGSVPSTFDEAWYLKNNPDIAAAVAAGSVPSAYEHWVSNGRDEGRIAPPGYEEGLVFDEAFYLRCYPMVAHEIAAGRALDAQEHYETIGRHRGYLPNGLAPRPDNPAGIVSRFGGFWLDHSNASDLIEGRLELGRLTADQATLLRHWVQHGYVILPQALPDALVTRAAAELHRAYDGQMEGARFECPVINRFHPVPHDAEVKSNPAKALDLHWLSEPIRQLIFAPQIRELLELIFERRAMASQSLTFLRGSTQNYHQDTVYVPYSLPTQFVASWIALEDVSPGGGELSYFPGSHKLPEHLYGGRFKTLWDAQRVLRRNSIRDEMAEYSERLEDQNRRAGLVPQHFMAKRGDVLLWHADLAHGGLPITTDHTRASVVTHYCPREVAPLTFERGNVAVRSHEGTAWYATGVYPDT